MNSLNPKIAFCISNKGRTQHLEQTLPQNLADNKDYENAKFILLDYNSQDHLLEFLKTNHQADIQSGRLVVYSYPEADLFKMAHAKNMAHRCGMLEGADILCNLDADNFTGPGFAHYIAEKFIPNMDGLFLWANRNQPEPVRFPKGCNGRIVVSTHAFLKTGGYDEAKYNSWGPDDKDFHFRLRRLGYLATEISREFLEVVLHSDKMRFREYPHLHKEVQDEGFQLVDETATIANFGKIGMGTVYKNFDFNQPIKLKALPTRIFGIGMHKTGTTSLHTAFKDLGYDSAHWKSVRWAKKVWREMGESGKSISLERSYALSDLPITILFRQLDAVYPGSKFILTTRNEDSWLKSIRYHWSKHNEHRDTWNKEDSFAKQMHKEVYGQDHFDPALFLARFRKHNAEVLEYFKNRPSDLLIMDMSNGAGWKKLCGFLDQPIPDVPYPFKYVTPVVVKKKEIICSADEPEPKPVPWWEPKHWSFRDRKVFIAAAVALLAGLVGGELLANLLKIGR